MLSIVLKFFNLLDPFDSILALQWKQTVGQIFELACFSVRRISENSEKFKSVSIGCSPVYFL